MNLAWLKTLTQTLWQQRLAWQEWRWILAITITCIVIGNFSLSAIGFLPIVPLQEHITQAHEQGFFQENYPQATVIIRPSLRVDMYTECFGLGIALQNRKNIKDIFLNTSYGECFGLSKAAQSDFASTPQRQYYRYQHGYVLSLRTLYTYFDIQTVRTITTVISYTLLILLAFCLKQRVSTAHAVVTMGSFFFLNSPSVFVLVTHATQFWLVLCACIAALFIGKHFAYLMAAVGALDALFTFLNMGSLSVSMPVLCYLLATWAHSNQKDDNTYFTLLSQSFWACLAWSVGFLLPWLCKWSILYFLYDISLDSIFATTLNEYPAKGVDMIALALYNNFMATHMEIWVILFVFLSWLRWKEGRTLPKGLWITMFPALIPLVWCCILPGQAGVRHSFFMNLILWPVFAFILFFLLTPEKNATWKDIFPFRLRERNI